MHRRHGNRASRVGLGTLIVGIVLSWMTLATSPAQAAEGPAASAPATARPHGPAQIHVHTPGEPVNVTVDWQWLYGRWQIKFNWAETRQMSRGLSYCNVVAALIPHWTSRVVSAACGILWVFADSAVSDRKCVLVNVSIAPTNPITFGKWDCPT